MATIEPPLIRFNIAESTPFACVYMVILRMQLLLVSATYKCPFKSNARPRGRLNDDVNPTPSANAADPLPASVFTTPPGVIFRMR